MRGELDIMLLLLNKGVDWTQQNKDGKTALKLAQEKGHINLSMNALMAAAANGKAKARPYAQMVEADGGDAPATEADAAADAPPTESTLADGVEKALAGEAEGGQRREVSLGID